MTDASETDAERENASLVTSSATMAFGTVLSRLSGFVRNIVVVSAIGTLVFADTYNLANTVPNILYILLIGGTLNSVFVPQLVRAMRSDPDGGEAYAQRLLTVTTLVLLAVTVLMVLAAPLVIAIYATDKWSDADVDLAVTFARFCLPQIFFYGTFAMFQQMLNSRNRFGPPMYTPILNNVVVIGVGVWFLALTGGDAPTVGTATDEQVRLLGLGTTLGIAAQALALVPFLRSVGMRLRPRFDWRGSGLGKARDLAGWAIMFVLVNQLGYLVIVKLATGAGKEAADAGLGYGVGLTVYQTAYLMFMLPHSVITVSVVTALLPRMSRHAAAGTLPDVRGDVSTGLRLAAVGIVPAALFFVVLGRDIGVTLYSLGAPGLAGAAVIGTTLAGFALGLVPFSVFHLLLRAFYAMEDTRTPALVIVGVNAANVAVALALASVLPVRLVVVGLAVAFGASYLVGLAIAVPLLRRRLGGLDGRRVLRAYARLALVAGVGALVAWGVATAAGAALGAGFVGSMVGLLVGAALGLALYLGMAMWLRISEVTDLIALVKGRLSG